MSLFSLYASVLCSESESDIDRSTALVSSLIHLEPFVEVSECNCGLRLQSPILLLIISF